MSSSHFRLLALLTLVAMPDPAAAAAGISLATCRTIESPSERLACYDRMADAQSQRDDEGTLQAPDVRPLPEDSSPLPPDGSREADTERWEQEFGKRQEAAPGSPPKEIRARIVSVTQSPYREDILTLDNGQVWMENEPSARAVEPGQDVLILKRRFSFTMELASGRTIKVHRVK